MVCFTIWLIATEILVFDQVRFNANAELLQQAARALRGPEVIVPTERPAHSTSDARMQNLWKSPAAADRPVDAWKRHRRSKEWSWELSVLMKSSLELAD